MPSPVGNDFVKKSLAAVSRSQTHRVVSGVGAGIGGGTADVVNPAVEETSWPAPLWFRRIPLHRQGICRW